MLVLTTSCSSAQSALHPAGRDAESIAALFFIMAAGALIIWLAVMGTALYAVIRADEQHPRRLANLFIVGGGVVLPIITLAALLIGGLSMLPGLLELGPDSQPAVRVTAEQWWWRVRYPLPNGGSVELANEVRLPVGRRVAIAVDSPDVVHSLWIPALAGKVDAIPGRTTHLGVEPTRAGVFRGVCAEYCGLSHALMLFFAVTMEPAAYEAWLAHQAEPAAPPQTALARQGQTLFLATGCGACHAIRGTAADGAVGPDLTHVGSRHSISGVLDNDVEGFVQWLTATDAIKPGVHMPAFDMLADADLVAIATYLESLQ